MKFTKQQWRAYTRLKVNLACQLVAGLPVFWVTLTSPLDTPYSKLRDSYGKLMQELDREFGERPDYMKVITSEGNYVIHAFWCFKNVKFIPYEWLKNKWETYHGAWNVWIERVGNTHGDAARVAWYSVAQYSIDQEGKAIRFDWSRKQKNLPWDPWKIYQQVRVILRVDLETFTPWKVRTSQIYNTTIKLLTKGVDIVENSSGRKVQIVFFAGELEVLHVNFIGVKNES